MILAFINLLVLGGVFLPSEGWGASKQVLDLPDGSKYEGEVVDDKRQGYGTLKDKSGKILKKGRFVNDEYVGP